MSRPAVLVTGAAGFGGSHLVEHLLDAGADVLALDLPAASRENLAAVADRVESLYCDLNANSPDEIARAFGGRQFAAVYHLAGLASVRRSWGELRRTLEVNALATLNLLEALLRQRTLPPLLLVGSAEQYGDAGEGPLAEDSPLAPVSPYALSKLWQESLGSFYSRLERWPVYFTRTFNHTGPRQSPDFVCSDFARQIARIEFRLEEPVLRVGNLTAERDFLDVRDVVAAYRLILERGRPGVPYNVASGGVHKIADLLRILLGHAVIRIKVEVDISRRRQADVPVLRGDPSRLRADTGWSQQRGIEESLADLLEHWRAVTSSEADAARASRAAGREDG